MDVREFFLYLHHANHFTGTAAWTLDAAMVPHYRTATTVRPLDPVRGGNGGGYGVTAYRLGTSASISSPSDTSWHGGFQ